MIRKISRNAAVLFAVMALVSCGDDDNPTGTGGGGGGNNLSLPAGTYSVETTYFDCGSVVGSTDPFELVACTSETVDDFMGYACPVKRSGNNLSVQCEITEEIYTGCSETVKIDLTGTVNGSVYTLMGTMEFSDNPSDCYDGMYCDSLYIRLERTGDAPAACSIADAGTMLITVTGGPLAGSRVLDAFGSSFDEGGGLVSWYMTGVPSGTPIAAARRIENGLTEMSVYLSTSALDPEGAPYTLPVSAANSPSTPGGPEAFIGYSEYTETLQFFTTSVTGGNVMVEEVDSDHIAGTFSVSVDGTQVTGGGSAPSSRSLAGAFHVVNSPVGRAEGGVFSRALATAFEAMRASRGE
jgi:hypothetical protein